MLLSQLRKRINKCTSLRSALYSSTSGTKGDQKAPTKKRAFNLIKEDTNYKRKSSPFQHNKPPKNYSGDTHSLLLLQDAWQLRLVPMNIHPVVNQMFANGIEQLVQDYHRNSLDQIWRYDVSVSKKHQFIEAHQGHNLDVVLNLLCQRQILTLCGQFWALQSNSDEVNTRAKKKQIIQRLCTFIQVCGIQRHISWNAALSSLQCIEEACCEDIERQEGEKGVKS